jgi:hypothetical protein
MIVGNTIRNRTLSICLMPEAENGRDTYTNAYALVVLSIYFSQWTFGLDLLGPEH